MAVTTTIALDPGFAARAIQTMITLVLLSGILASLLRNLSSIVSAYVFQSGTLVGIALLLYLISGNEMLAYLSLFAIVSKMIIVPYVIRRAQRRLKLSQDGEFHLLSPTTAVLLSTVLVLLVYSAFSKILFDLFPDKSAFYGIMTGLSLVMVGLLTVFCRRKILTKTVGYLAMENGVLLFGLFLVELPLIIEVLILVDLVMIVVILAILALGVDSHAAFSKGHPLSAWFEEGESSEEVRRQ